MRVKITWSNGNVEFCTAYKSIEELTRNYFGAAGVPSNVKVEDPDAHEEQITATPDAGSSAQPEVREESGSPAKSSKGVRASGQKSRKAKE